MIASEFTSWQTPVDITELLVPLVPINLMKNESNIILHNVMAIYALAQDALEKLQNHELKAFDALATDCSCHLRALCLQDIVTNLKEDTDLQLSLSHAIANLSQKVQGLYQLALALMNKEISQPTKIQEKQHAKKCGCFTKALLIKEVWKTHHLPGLFPFQQIFCLQESKRLLFKVLKKKPEYNTHAFLAKMGLTCSMPTGLAYAISANLLTRVKKYVPVNGGKFKCEYPPCSVSLTENDRISREVTNQEILATQSQVLLQKNYGIDSAPIHKTYINNKVYNTAKILLTTLSQNALISQAHTFGVGNLLQNTCKAVVNKLEMADYYSLTATFAVALQKQIPVILKVQKCIHAHEHQEVENTPDVALYLKSDKRKFFPAPLPASEFLEQPVIVVVGKRAHTQSYESTGEYVIRLMQDFDFLKQCEMDGAQHRQYTSDKNKNGNKLEPSSAIELLQMDEYKTEAKKINTLKEQAQKSGCSLNNQSKLVFAHIFADILKNQIASPSGLFEQTWESISGVVHE